VIHNDPATATAYAKAGRGNLPMMGIAIFDGEAPAPPAPVAELPASDREIWVPVKEPAGAFWVRFPAGVKPTGNETVAGFVVGAAQDFPGLTQVCNQLSRPDAGRVLYQQTKDGYLAEVKAWEGIVGAFRWKHAIWLAAGVALLGGAVWRARYE
jgi:hypothetical protein